jgi:orotate phosphoribosyltransferase
MTGPTEAASTQTGTTRDGRSRDSLKERLLSLVLERGYARSAEPFLLSSGGTSCDYVDLRRAVARGDDLRLAAEAVLAAVEDEGVEFDAVGGMTMGADPVAHAVALMSGTAWYSVRKAEKSHGSRRRIEGMEMGPGVRTLLFEDTVSTSRSMSEALDVVTASGAEVVLACTLLDRGDIAAALMAERSIPYRALLDYRDLGIEPIVSGSAGATTPSSDAGEEATH